MSTVAIRIEELTRRFIGSLPERVTLLEGLQARARGDPSSLAELSCRLHALCGTAATYGVMDVALLAQEGECVCDMTVVDFDALDGLIDAIRKAVAQ